MLSLNGDAWRFQLFDRPEAVPPAFGAADFDAGAWLQVCESTGVRQGAGMGREERARRQQALAHTAVPGLVG